jgi:hypothetical protein
LKILLVLKNIKHSKIVDKAIIPPKAPSTKRIDEQHDPLNIEF